MFTNPLSYSNLTFPPCQGYSFGYSVERTEGAIPGPIKKPWAAPAGEPRVSKVIKVFTNPVNRQKRPRCWRC